MDLNQPSLSAASSRRESETRSVRDRLAGDLSSRDSARASDRRIFASVLAKARQDGPVDPVAAAGEAAENLVSVALVQPMLSKMRQSSWAAEPFKPTSGENSFRSMFDNAMSLKLVRSGNWPLVDKVKERMLARTTAEAAPATTTVANPLPAAALAPSAGDTIVAPGRRGLTHQQEPIP